MDTQTLTIAGVSGVGLIFIVVQAAKEAGMDSRFAPLASLGIGVLLGVLAQAIASQVTGAHANYALGALIGLTAGAAASGVYSGVKTVSSPPAMVGLSATPLTPPASPAPIINATTTPTPPPGTS